MILLDTGGLYAYYGATDRFQSAADRILSRDERRILSPFVLAELDYLVRQRVGQSIAMQILSDVVRGAYDLDAFDSEDVARAQAIIERYRGLGIGLTDASIVVLAERYNCHDVLTLDQRHFRTITTLDGTPFRLLPLDDLVG